MAFTHGKVSRLLLDTLMYSGFLKEIENGVEVDLADTTTFATTGGHSWTPGLHGGSLSLQGFLDNATVAGSQNPTAVAALGAADTSVITSAPAGLAVGSPVSMLAAREQNYNVNSPVAEAVQFQTSWQSDGTVDGGVSLLDPATAISGGVGDVLGTNVDNGASSANGAAAHLHVTANTRNGNTTVIVQHSVDNSVWVDLITFTVVGTGLTSSQRATVAGTVNRHLRSKVTKAGTTGSITLAVAAARR